MSDLLRARTLLCGHTCVLCLGDVTHTSTLRGVRPLLDFLEGGEIAPHFSAADRVVGKGAAFLYVLLGADAVYAEVLSRPALSVFERHGIKVEWTTLVDGIINRKGDGPCPIEAALCNCDCAGDALDIIKQTLKSI